MFSFPQGFFKALSVILPLLLGAGWAPDSFAEEILRVGIVKADRLNLRRSPDITSQPLKVLGKGTRVTLLGREGGWVKVQEAQNIGYIRNLPEYLQLLGGNPTGAPEASRLRVLEQKASRIEADLETRKDAVLALSGEETAVLDALNDTERALNRMDRQRIDIRSRMDALQKKIARLYEHSKERTRQIDTTRTYALKRLTAFYKLHQMGPLPLMASARSVHEYLYLEKGLSRILDRDETTLTALAKQQAALRETLDELKEKEQEHQVLEQRYRSRMASMEAEKAKREAFLKTIQSRKALQLASIQELERASQRLADTLKALRRPIRAPERTSGKTDAFTAMKGLLEMPVEGKIVGRFGAYPTPGFQTAAQRNGIEIKAETGAPVKAVFGGKVVFSDWFRSYGNLIIIDHGEGYYTVYARARELFKGNGENVELGEVIATVGDIGSLTTPSLYFEVRHHEKPIDPMGWIKSQ